MTDKGLFVEFAVADTFGFFQSQTFGLIDFVVGIRTFEEEDLAIAFKSENVGTDTVEEPTGRG